VLVGYGCGMAAGEPLLSIGEVAARVGMRTSALRYYEEEGLISPDARSAAGAATAPRRSSS
jgi:MerR-like DNA binding protein